MINRRFLASAAVLCLLVPILTACGDDDNTSSSLTPPPGPAPRLLRFQPEKDVKVDTPAAAAPTLGGDPLDSGGDRLVQHDPMDSGGDALVKDSDKKASRDPLSAAGTTNWYWLRGSISGGTITVQVNGITLGQYSVHMDKEITRMLHPGGNSITFTPQRDNPQTPVQADLEVVYSQMTQGQLPPLVYDTRQIAQPTSPSFAKPPASVYKRIPRGGDSADDSSSGTPAATKPTPVSLAAPAPQDTSTTLTFIAQ